MADISTSSLGWTAGQNISNQFESVVEGLNPGDRLIFDHMYNINMVDAVVPNNVTFDASVFGAGLNALNFDTENSPIFQLSDGCTLLNFTITHKDVVGSAEDYNGATVWAFGDNITINNSSFSGKPKEFVRIGGDSFTVLNSTFDGAYYQQRWFGACTNFVVDGLLSRYCEGDGIKTARSGNGFGTKDAIVRNSVFIGNLRDGIDTTGGFENCQVLDCYFVLNKVSGLDIKAPFKLPSDLSLDQVSRNITISRCEFVNTNKAVVLTTNDKEQLLTDQTFFDWCPQNITLDDCIFENPNSVNNAIVLAKGCKDVFITNSLVLGKLNPFKFDTSPFLAHLTINVNDNLVITNEETGNPRPGQPNSFYEALAGSSFSVAVDPGPPIDPPGEVSFIKIEGFQTGDTPTIAATDFTGTDSATSPGWG